MTPEDLDKIIEANTLTIKSVVNGKIDALMEDFCKLRDEFNEHKKQMEPVIEGLATVQGGRKFILWIATPLAALGTIWAFLTNFK